VPVAEHTYFVYIVASRSRTLYIGITGRLIPRIREHREGTFDGFTAKYNCNRLVYYERYQYVNQAITREKQLKGWRREKKLALIEKLNPSWIDLSERWWRPVPQYKWTHEERRLAELRRRYQQNAGPSTTLRSAQDDKSVGDENDV
jgi:putative endonuclease